MPETVVVNPVETALVVIDMCRRTSAVQMVLCLYAISTVEKTNWMLKYATITS